ncbi:MAG: alanyl-tRNA editing protein [Bacillati bacterium ANGP1]|uniref:Alanyl-tRNA editing protein n=1 Tax=Candidatus Segetimicrobium genomatis TaxID=2569760 RepID=A0A537LZS7_9BACT|nr:MAG: alanyl-tRNA editing protein [Terrabacteria group bacterium ANGP1]
MTERLYYADSYLTQFEATVLASEPHGDRLAVILDRTAFYPTSGGQPHDTGTLSGVPVTDVIEDGEDRVLHLVSAPLTGAVAGAIDWPRRFDHMQQHTGQHILSQAFLQAMQAQTRAVHLGAELCTLDLDLADLSAAAAAQVEDLANRIVFEDRPVLVYEVDEAELSSLGLRRPAKKRGRIRVVDVEEFDRSACGGTHVRRTGEIGAVRLRRWERFKGGMRVEFLCGWRALRDSRWKNALVRDLAVKLSVKDQEVAEAVERLMGQLRERDRTLAGLRDQLVELEAQRRLENLPGTPRIVTEVLPGWSAEMTSALAGRLAAAGSTIAALATSDGRVIVARSSDLDLDAAALLRRALEPLGGRGGGRPAFAQGAVPPEQVHDALASLRAEVHRVLGVKP